MRTVTTLACILGCALSAAADEVELLNGGRFSGIVREEGDRVIIDMQFGSVSFKKIDVKRIDYSKPSAMQEYEARKAKADLANRGELEQLLAWAESRKLVAPAAEIKRQLLAVRRAELDYADAAAVVRTIAWARIQGFDADADEIARGALALRRAAMKPGDAQALYEAGMWARARGVEVDALLLFKDAITVDPDHEFARRAMGYVRYQGEWMTDRDVKRAMGLIEFEGEWVTPAAKEAILQARTIERERLLLEEERSRLESERAAARAEFDRRVAELEARSREVELRILEARRRPVYVYPPRVVHPADCPPSDVQPPPCPPTTMPRPTRAPHPNYKYAPAEKREDRK